MMRKVLGMGAVVITAALGLFAAPAMATEYTGGGFLTPTSASAAACSTGGISGSQQVIARFRPAGLLGNPSNLSSLVVYGERSALAIDLPATPAAVNSWFNAQRFLALNADVQTVNSASMRYTSRPNTFTAADFRIEMEMRNFRGITNCTMRLHSIFYRG